MKKQIPAIVLAVASIALAVALYSANQQIKQLKQQLAALPPASSSEPEPAPIDKSESVEVATVATASTVQVMAEPISEPVSETEPDSGGQRMMKNISKMLENPAMNKMMEASQRGVIEAMYADLIEQLDLSEEEKKYFMDLLMFRQMTQVNFSMKIMSGTLSDEEKTAMQEELKEAAEIVKTEMESFLNNDEDYSEFEFFEQTIGERMMLSQAEAKLAGTEASLSDETYRDLLEMMHDEKESFDFSGNLQDNTNTDLSPERFSEQNIQNLASDLDRLNKNIFAKAKDILSPDQFEAFKDAVTTTTDMQKSQLEMAAQMFRN